MSKIIKWKYEGYDLKFYSTETQFERHTEQIWPSVGARTKPNIKIIEDDVRTDIISIDDRPCKSCPPTESTIPVGAEATTTSEQETVGLQSMHEFLDSDDNSDDYQPDGLSDIGD